MEFPVKRGEPGKQKTGCAILPLFDGGPLPGPTRAMDAVSKGLIRRLLRAGDASAKLGRVVDVPGPAGRFLLVGCGPRKRFDAQQLTKALGAAAQALQSTGLKEATSYLTREPLDGVDAYYAARLTVQAMRSAAYRFSELKSQSEPAPKLARVGIAIEDGSATTETRRGIAHGEAIANGMDLARDLGNRPPNVCTPSHLAAAARELAKRHRRLQVKVLNEADMRRLGMGALLSVTHGAVEPARLIVLQYRGAGQQAPIALCGKGITFDTGGISLKPPPKMDEMKYDMCGAAGVLGTFAALGELEPRLNVVGIVPACENMPSGQATRPGDIVRTMSGQTVEILNTDAEGRLILCDALTYAQREFKPRYVLDVATLTGACIIALGNTYTGLFSNDETLASAVLDAGSRSLDRAWRLPVGEEYGESLKSNFADFANSGAREGGASIAANFLSRFVENTAWAHLDIAGVAWRSNADKGATGRPVPLLTDLLLNLPDTE